MNFSDFVTHHGKKVNKDYFISLIQVSRIDGKIAPVEHEMLLKEGKKFGLTEPEIEKLIASEANHHYHAPYSLNDKFEQLYNVAVMILADEVVTDTEKRMLKRFAIEAGFDDKAVSLLTELLLEGIRNNQSDEELLAKFREKMFK
jgi:urease gamma subunit